MIKKEIDECDEAKEIDKTDEPENYKRTTLDDLITDIIVSKDDGLGKDESYLTAKQKKMAKKLLTIKKYFAGFIVGLLFGSVCEALFKAVDIVKDKNKVYIVIHCLLIASLLFTTWFYNKLAGKLELMDVKNAIEYTTAVSAKERRELRKEVLDSYMHVLDLHGLQYSDRVKHFGERLNKIRRLYNAIRVLIITSLLLLLGSIAAVIFF